MSDRVEIVNGDSLLVLQLLDENSVDAIVTDPPYGLAFMGKKWDYDVPSEELWRQCFRVLKAGGHLLCFAGTRTQHRMAVRIEDAGFEIRDMIAWVYGSGFPKSLDVSKAIDKAAGAEREVVGETRKGAQSESTGRYGAWGDGITPTLPATPEAKQWEGWGTALKPALEPITVARKPLIGTVAENVLQHGTGAINVDGCRVGERWPANFIHDGSEEVTDLLGSAARFFYCAKASKRDRDEGCEGMELVTHQSGMGGAMPVDDDGNARDRFKAQSRNHHPTVKPTDLMRYLCRLVTPPDGTVLDPFMGSGSTGKAAVLEGFRFIGIEREEEYCEIAKARIKHAQQ
jgi:DNA modification methylase